ncbi:VanZ family protein [Geminicoccaceae bacterium 1502E]|nr:VanZ family protein [Geminicoccaceae bacterium 1502E]
MRRLLLNPPRRLLLGLWCLGWLVVAFGMLSPDPGLPASVDDKLAHALGFGLVTLAAASFATGPRAMLGISALTFLLSALFETCQLFVPGRMFDPADLVANASGIVIGCATGLLWLRRVLPALARAIA